MSNQIVTQSVAEYLCQSLSANEIDTVFGIPGVHTVELYRALADSPLRHITPRNEQAAGFMADGYARASGRVAACFTITGPGLTNIATAMGQALADSVPMLVVSSVNPVGRMGSGRGYLHEMPDQRAFAAQISVFSHTVLDPAELPAILARAFAVFQAERPGPVYIEIPVNLFTAAMPAGVTAARFSPPSRPAAQAADLERMTELLRAAERPVILAGGGAADCAAAVTQLAECIDAPVVMTCNGRGLLPDSHPLAVPCSPALPPIRSLIAGADLVLALGTEIGPAEYDFYNTGPTEITGAFVRVDIDPRQIARGPACTLGIVADVAAVLSALPMPTPRKSDGAQRARHARDAVKSGTSAMYATGQETLHSILQTLPDAIIVGDSAQPVYAGMMHFGTQTPRSWFVSATGFGTLGYALSAATGAWLATGRPVIAVIGDGGFQFNAGELATAREINCPLIVLLWNNAGYFEIANYMRRRDIPTLGVDIFTPDFVQLARAYDCYAVAIAEISALVPALQVAAAGNRPTLLECDEARLLTSAAEVG